MSSFDAINYALRPSKSIQRQLIFEGIQKLHSPLSLENAAYIGLGSIWFTDFVLAHRLLGIEDMISMEANEIGFARARFNVPYATVRVLQGTTSELLPSLYLDNSIAERPWVIWLDYDGEFQEDVRADVRSVIENSPQGTIFLITFNGHEMSYGRKPTERPERLRYLFGDLVADDMPNNACKGERMQESLADLAIQYMQTVAAETSRRGGFIPAFRVIYKDGSPMITVGGVLPAPDHAASAANIVNGTSWKCRPQSHIIAPHLTLREAAMLQAKLPRPTPLNRVIVQELGFDLEDDQIRAFENYYRLYPSYAQVFL